VSVYSGGSDLPHIIGLSTGALWGPRTLDAYSPVFDILGLILLRFFHTGTATHYVDYCSGISALYLIESHRSPVPDNGFYH